MQPTALIFFFAFTLVIVVMYLALRRAWASPTIIGGVGILAAVITMTLTLMSQPNVSPQQGIILGVGIGLAFGVAVLAVAWYFQSSQTRELYAEDAYPDDE